MNSSGWIRGMMSKNVSAEKFLLHVATCIEGQLKEWDTNYEVYVMKFTDYQFVVKNGEKYIELKLTADEVTQLQSQSPYSLDKRIWTELKEQGLTILMGMGIIWIKCFRLCSKCYE